MADVDDIDELIATRKLHGLTSEIYEQSEADRIFKELNYEEHKYLEHTDYYNADNDKIISFRKDKSVQVFNCYDGTEPITMQELKAINLKCKELGWIEE